MRTALLFLCFFLGVVPVRADLFDGPCVRYGVPKRLAVAIAKTESSLHPWVVNVAGRDFRPATKQQAADLIRAARAKGLSHDVGLMQINSWWLERLGVAPETALEPRANVLIGVWILAGEIQRHGLTWKAVGAYHSPTPSRQLRYTRAVWKNLK